MALIRIKRIVNIINLCRIRFCDSEATNISSLADILEITISLQSSPTFPLIPAVNILISSSINNGKILDTDCSVYNQTNQ